MIACSAGHRPLTRFLVEHGADIHLQDDEGCNALMHAIRSGSVELIRMLLQTCQPDSGQAGMVRIVALLYSVLNFIYSYDGIK
jgi:ankyrin repeat protein